MIDFINTWSDERSGLRPLQLVDWLGISRSKYYDSLKRYGKANEHNRLIPRNHWLQDWERHAIIDFHHKFPLEGYRRLTFMMLDRDVVAVNPSTTCRALKAAGLIAACDPKLVSARLQLKINRQNQHAHSLTHTTVFPIDAESKQKQSHEGHIYLG